jgi:hypothetical protein
MRKIQINRGSSRVAVYVASIYPHTDYGYAGVLEYPSNMVHK